VAEHQVREEIVIDFVEPNSFEEQSERAKELYDLGKSNDDHGGAEVLPLARLPGYRGIV
jgi:hypothetical protein